MSENHDDKEGSPEDKMVLTKCSSCGRMMLTLRVGTRRICKECLDKVNKPMDLKQAEEQWKAEKMKWAQEEKQLFEERKVG